MWHHPQPEEWKGGYWFSSPFLFHALSCERMWGAVVMPTLIAQDTKPWLLSIVGLSQMGKLLFVARTYVGASTNQSLSHCMHMDDDKCHLWLPIPSLSLSVCLSTTHIQMEQFRTDTHRPDLISRMCSVCTINRKPCTIPLVIYTELKGSME